MDYIGNQFVLLNKPMKTPSFCKCEMYTLLLQLSAKLEAKRAGSSLQAFSNQSTICTIYL